ncbi:putative serine/threonine-protein kinase iks1 [Puccinia graminis f. sp. tritici]|uniref:non-specific serine/threonine protein kinase n=1 Tax=Puccinia graminis f. sp. tritici TaxID=56615 RepID=A0A5B0NC79_PUCGR|nr:putative serine/threonine-protein kinase iks1 [Puccinia graminis f. sp. tritici]KAA1135977.1 putative serine/threonine-protein kinase iks1 [Puccinia graminis f. sp. tritici]
MRYVICLHHQHRLDQISLTKPTKPHHTSQNLSKNQPTADGQQEMVNNNLPSTTNSQQQQQQQQQQQWQVVLRQSTGKLVLYHSTSNRLSVHHSIPTTTASSSTTTTENSLQLQSSSRSLSRQQNYKNQNTSYCPLCLQALNISPIPTNNDNKQQQAQGNNTQSTSTQPNSYYHQRSNRPLTRSALPAHQDSQQQPPPSISQTNTHTITQESYFDLLSQSNTPLPSRPISPIQISSSPLRHSSSTSSISSLDSLRFPTHNPSDNHEAEDYREPLGQEKRVDGYYHRFFIEVLKLGRGQKGSVFLCTHILDGNALGDYAIKKIAVGQSSHELMQVLSEVKFLESLRHPNITQYHHAWIEKAQLSRFGPKVPVLYILMNFANGGTLEDYICLRKGSKNSSSQVEQAEDEEGTEEEQRRNRQKQRFRQQRTKPQSILPGLLIDPLSAWKNLHSSSDPLHHHNTHKKSTPTDRAVHLFGFEEIFSIFEDTCRGLGFLHSQGILHHDLKTENVLLHWASEDAMIPTALISDFGSSISQSENWSRERTGRTGTLDWVPPESLKKDPKTGKLIEVTQKGDLWQLGLVLHCLCFFRLPYTHSEDIDLLKDEIIKYPGFLIDEYPAEQGSTKRKMNNYETGHHHHQQQHSSRSDLPRGMLELLSDLLCLDPRLRPSCERVLRSLEKLREETSGYETSSQTKPSAGVMVPGGQAADLGSTGVGIVGPASALVKRRRILIDPSVDEEDFSVLPSPDSMINLQQQPSTHNNHNKELFSILPDPAPSSSSSSPYPPPPLSSPLINHHRHQHQHHHQLLEPDLTRNLSRHPIPLFSSSSTIAPASFLKKPSFRVLNSCTSRFSALGFALFICFKSIFFIQLLSTANSPKSSMQMKNKDYDQPQGLDQIMLMALIIFNTFELLLCHPLVSVLVTLFEVFWIT